MIYKFTYFFDNKLLYKTCTTEREALIFFNILASAKIPFKIITITKRGNRYGYL